MKTVSDFNFKGKKVLVRVDYNVPIDKNRVISDDTRIKRSKETIQRIVSDGGRVVLLSHLGRPGKEPNKDLSFETISQDISKTLEHPVSFVNQTVGESATKAITALQDGQILLLENVRFHKEEETNDQTFSRALAEPIDFYVNEAFGCSHRAHASVDGLPRLLDVDRKCGGVLLNKEVQSPQQVFQTKGVKTAIIGGSKISTKTDILRQLINKVDNLIIGGAMVFTFIKAQGGQVGSSLTEDTMLDTARNVLKQAKQKGITLYLPKDTLVADALEATANTQYKNTDEIPEGYKGVDIGPKAIQDIEQILLNSHAILWNGPMGVFEIEPFSKGTKSVGDLVVKATSQGAFSVVGGGDTVAAVNQYNQQDHISYICTGGGAMLDLLAGKVLPGIAALES